MAQQPKGIFGTIRVFALLLFLCVTTTKAFSQVTGLTDLRSLRNRARPLLIFAPKPDDPRLQIQLRMLREHAAEASDRDIVPIALPYNNLSPSEVQLSSANAEAARRHFNVDPDAFAVVLIGKDGGAKLHAAKPLPMRELNETIDAMPMRKDEVRAKQGK